MISRTAAGSAPAQAVQRSHGGISVCAARRAGSSRITARAAAFRIAVCQENDSFPWIHCILCPCPGPGSSYKKTAHRERSNKTVKAKLQERSLAMVVRATWQDACIEVRFLLARQIVIYRVSISTASSCVATKNTSFPLLLS